LQLLQRWLQRLLDGLQHLQRLLQLWLRVQRLLVELLGLLQL
jgi:hypothetical protein